mmetsp:Transcript_39727/g.88272  ORF Transcript_39727/g.88272 Transcript_39727/m.88272 type:complete len:209 (+) Transcript_39727:932-1558(+)
MCGIHDCANLLGPGPGLLPKSPVNIVGLLGDGVAGLLPAVRQGHPHAGPEALHQRLAVQPPPDEHNLTQPRLIVPPGLVAGAVADGLVHTLEHKLLGAIPMYCQHPLAPEDVLGLLCQDVPHEHVEAVLVQGTTRHNAHAAHVRQVVQLLSPPLGPPCLLRYFFFTLSAVFFTWILQRPLAAHTRPCLLITACRAGFSTVCCWQCRLL